MNGGFLPGSLTNGGTSTLSLVSGSSTPPGTYAVTISATSGTLTHEVAISIVVDPAALPFPLTMQSIGAAPGGSAVQDKGAIRIVSAGSSLATTSDSFQFVSQTLSGDATVLARIGSVQNGTGTARYGVMMRGDVTATAPGIFFGLLASVNLGLWFGICVYSQRQPRRQA